MNFIDQLRQFSSRIVSMSDNILTKEVIKASIIMPPFSMLGYDILNPEEFVPEYTADVGIKKGKKVYCAVVKDGEPVILIEVKSVNENLEKYGSQRFHYTSASGYYFGTPKTTRFKRPLHLPGSTFMVLTEYRYWQQSQKQALGDAWQGTADDNRVFTTDDGHPMFPITPM
ncbi:MAG TPA: hypothetical protein DIW17_17880 [Clostridiales bacterium]|jgi:predicted type IV restriction endonuclease|nr:hypothetical protein [Clostridiales bacterium]